ncbi:hypothetical protein GCM10023310_39140 [Paenibacillus vulneris]
MTFSVSVSVAISIAITVSIAIPIPVAVVIAISIAIRSACYVYAHFRPIAVAVILVLYDIADIVNVLLQQVRRIPGILLQYVFVLGYRPVRHRLMGECPWLTKLRIKSYE